MKKRMVVLWVSLLCLCGLFLPSCGGSAGTEEKDSPAKDSPAAEVAVDPAEKFYGTWKLAAMKSQNLTIVGDFSMFMDAEDGETIVMVIEKGGAGTISLGEDSHALTWELADDNTLSVKPDKPAEDEDEAADGSPMSLEKLDFVYGDDGITATYEDEEVSYAMVFTESGSLADEPEVDMTKATDVTSLDELAGTWSLSTLKYGGATMYGAPEDLAAMYGDDVDTVLEIAADGSSRFLGQDSTVTVGEDGASIDYVIYQIPVRLLGDDIAINMGELLGIDLVFIFSK